MQNASFLLMGPENVETVEGKQYSTEHFVSFQ